MGIDELDIIVENVVEELPSIELGDLFMSPEGEVFQFSFVDTKDRHFPYVLANLSGEGVYNAYNTKNIAIENLCGLIGYSKLTHYPKKDWKLQLKRK